MSRLDRDTQLIIIGMGLGVIALSSVRMVADGGVEAVVGAMILIWMLHLIGTSDDLDTDQG